jgi:hypothetical protein
MKDSSGSLSMRDSAFAAKAVLRFLAIVLSLGVLASVISGCFVSMKGSGEQALSLATAFHQKMANGDLAGIYTDAHQRYRDAVTREKSDALFSSIARKLGAPLDCKVGNTNLRVATAGTTIVSVCQTKFAKDATGVETFTWMKSDDRFRLLGYHINSEELIER